MRSQNINFTVHACQGLIKYRDTSCIALIDQGIVDYYRAVIPKYKRAKPQKYPAHVTVFRKWEKFIPGYRNEEIISIQYISYIYESDIYYYLNCWSDDIADIRENSGLQRYRVNNCYHITIANKKDT